MDGRFYIEPAEEGGRFTYAAGQAMLTTHYNTAEPSAWYVRPIDPTGIRSLSRRDDFEFSVTFRVRSEDFLADPEGYAQIAWGLLNSQTTGIDRSYGLVGPYAFDCVTFDYFPNVNAVFGGPSIGSAVLYSNNGTDLYPAISFAMEPEGEIGPDDESIALDTIYTARVVFDAMTQLATVTLRDGDRFLLMNADTSTIPGGLDGDPTTIQTEMLSTAERDFRVDSFALTAWNDYWCSSPSVVADVEITRIEFSAPALHVGDLNRDGLVDGRDVEPFLSALLLPNPSPGILARGDFTGDGALDLADLQPFVERLMQP
ncbi:MAG TPA: hypothetical protein VMV94_02255 [Phycisphaerae bacterium]|nr:hypothetical protein [Phycisphaerae bacterium]